MPEESQIANGVVCKYTAYDIKKTKALKDVTLLKNENVAVCRFYRNLSKLQIFLNLFPYSFSLNFAFIPINAHCFKIFNVCRNITKIEN